MSNRLKHSKHKIKTLADALSQAVQSHGRAGPACGQAGEKCYLESVLNCCCTYLVRVMLSVSTVLCRVIPVLRHIVVHCKGALFKLVNF